MKIGCLNNVRIEMHNTQVHNTMVTSLNSQMFNNARLSSV